MPIVLHGNPQQSEGCLLGLVGFAQRLAQEGSDGYAQLGGFQSVVDHIRSRHFEAADGRARRGVRCSFRALARRWWWTS